jgi:hypothetical protein
MSRIAFDCAKCFKTLQLEERIYKKAYEGHTLCMSCRPSVKVEQILSEEELNQLENFAASADGLSETNSYKVIESHRLLFAANAELSFNNLNAKAKVKEYYLGLKSSEGKYGLTEMNVYHATQAIEHVLDAFKIKVEDVNA